MKGLRSARATMGMASWRLMARLGVAAVATLVAGSMAVVSAQQAQTVSPTPSQEPPPGQAPAGGRQGGAPAARAAAPVDLTGTWVSIVTEDWRWRMMVPPKGNYDSVPLNPEGVKVVESWDPARDVAAGEQCRAYGAGGVMRLPGRVRISWQDDNTLKVETEAGTQTRLFRFRPGASEAPSWQGTSNAAWQVAGGGGGRRGGGAPPRGGSLRVVTTNLKPGYLRRNGVPYSANARVTEYYNRLNEANGDSWLIVTTVIEDPTYLQTPRWATSTHFKKAPDGSPWKPTPCS